MKLRKWELALMIALVITVCCGFAVNREQEALSENLVRLHVVANSDSEKDQSLKLRVRDAVLTRASAITQEAENQDQAVVLLENSLSSLEDAALDALKKQGSDQTVSVTLKEENFPTRNYETFSLPAGEYMTLRVVLGDGEGKNWWCVVFPSLCTQASMDGEQAVMSLDPEQQALITQSGAKYVVKFKFMELFGRLRSFFQ